MRSALFAVAVTALMGGLVVAPVTQQTAEAQVYSGLKPLAPLAPLGPNANGTPYGGDLVLVGRGGRGGGGHGGGHGSGRGGHGGGHAARGGGHRGGSHVSRGGRGGSHAYRGGSRGYKGRHYSAPKHHYRGGGNKKHYTYKNRRYYYGGRYYRNYGWYGYGYGYGYGCAWLRQRALVTGSSYWWQRYYDCIY